jgi:hypothetical protein
LKCSFTLSGRASAEAALVLKRRMDPMTEIEMRLRHDPDDGR